MFPRAGKAERTAYKHTKTLTAGKNEGRLLVFMGSWHSIHAWPDMCYLFMIFLTAERIVIFTLSDITFLNIQLRMAENSYHILCKTKSKMKKKKELDRIDLLPHSLEGVTDFFRQRWLHQDEVMIYSWLPRGPRHSISCSHCSRKQSRGKKNSPKSVTASCTHSPAEPSLSTYTY